MLTLRREADRINDTIRSPGRIQLIEHDDSLELNLFSQLAVELREENRGVSAHLGVGSSMIFDDMYEQELSLMNNLPKENHQEYFESVLRYKPGTKSVV